MPAVRLLTLALLATVAVGVTTALLAWRERREPGAKPLVAMLVGQCWWSAFLVFQLQATTLGAKILWVNVSWLGVVVIPVAWVLFAMEYTGRDQFLRARYVALLSVVPAITVVLALTGEYHDLLYVDSRLVERGGRLVIDRKGGPWFWVIAGYTYLLGVVGAVPLLDLVRSHALPFRGQSAALLVGIVTPWGINALFLGGVIPTQVDPTPIGFAISGTAYLGAITRFRLFGTSPSPNYRARRLVFERMQDGAIVVDRHDHVVEMNDSAADILGTTPGEALGKPAPEVFPDYRDLPEDGSMSGHLTISGGNGERPYDVTTTRISDVRDREIGRVITFHDVGEHLRQQQRLEVLNRALRHNIRTETNIISGYADLMAGEDGVTELVKQHAMRIDAMAEKARMVSEVFEQEDDPTEVLSLGSIIEESAASVEEGYPEVAVDCNLPREEIHVAGVLAPVLSNAIENAAEHNTDPDPEVRIDAEADDGRVRVTVADNGPGIDDSERAALERGTETPLEHGSGLGLWLIKWGVEIAGGEVRFESGDPGGTVVTIEVPVLPAPAARDRPGRVTT